MGEKEKKERKKEKKACLSCAEGSGGFPKSGSVAVRLRASRERAARLSARSAGQGGSRPAQHSWEHFSPGGVL